MPTSHGNARYARQLSLPGFGPEQQQRLADAHVCCVGAGGLGSPALLYLAAAGVGTITIIDDDTVDVSNLHRQVIHTTSQVGHPKVESRPPGAGRPEPRGAHSYSQWPAHLGGIRTPVRRRGCGG